MNTDQLQKILIASNDRLLKYLSRENISRDLIDTIVELDGNIQAVFLVLLELERRVQDLENNGS
jgi:hypothetical protein